MTIFLRYAAFSDVGRVRKNNQDSAYASPRLLMLADGMGGGPAGDLASSVTTRMLRRLDTAVAPDDLLEALAGAVQRANDRLGEAIESDPAVEGMGTTLTAVLADGDQVGLAHVGDSRAYLLRGGELTQLTHDHTFVQSLVDQGRISPAEARRHPHRSLILQVLDGRHEVDPDLEILTLVHGDRLLLCSDGLTDFVEDEQIEALLGGETVDVAAVELVHAALDAGTSDNVTCVVAEAVEGDNRDAGTEPLLIGAAAEQPRPGGGVDTTSSRSAVVGPGPDPDIEATSGRDPEELRYAPQPPRRFPRIRLLLALVLLLALLGGGAAIAYRWSQRQYYVGTSDGNIAIYRGLDQHLPGLDLSSLYAEYDLLLDELPAYQRGRVETGIEADSLAAAQRTVDQLETDAAQCAAGQDAAGTPQCEGATSSPTDPTTATEPTPSERTPADGRPGSKQDRPGNKQHGQRQ